MHRQIVQGWRIVDNNRLFLGHEVGTESAGKSLGPGTTFLYGSRYILNIEFGDE